MAVTDIVVNPTRVLQVPDTAYLEENVSVEDSSDYRSLFAGTSTSIVIDNGSSQVRAGWANEARPRIIQDQVVSRYRDRKLNKTILLYGEDVDADATSRGTSRQVFEGDVLVNYDSMEHVLDYIFLNLGIDTQTVPHPVVMSERLSTPLHSRALTSELLFELYSAPSISYGVDSLFSFSNTVVPAKDGFVVGLGHHSTTLVPVLNGKGILSSARRIPWGGFQASEFLLKLSQMKYPNFPTKVSSNQATFMYRETCYVADDYQSHIRMLQEPNAIAQIDTILQFPFVESVVEEKTEEELARQAEKRKESGKRLQEVQNNLRTEKLQQKQKDLEYYQEIRGWKATESEADFELRLESEGFDNEADLEGSIKKLEASLKRAKQKDIGEEAEDTEVPSFPLINIPDKELTEEDIKEKRKQKLYKANYDARVRLKAEKAAETARLEEISRLDEEERLADPVAWTKKVRERHEATITRISERKRRKAALSDRKSAAAQSRMKSIADLASGDSRPKKKTKKGEEDDGFGRTDDDWGVYREIRGGESDEEEEDMNLVLKLEKDLMTYDPTFAEEETLSSRSSQHAPLITAFLRGSTKYKAEEISQQYQLHLNIERARVPEVWFQPSMTGLDSAGIDEIIGHVLKTFKEEEVKRMMQGIYITGGGSLLQGFDTRLHKSLPSLLPYQTPLRVLSPSPKSDTRISAWQGMARWASTGDAEFREALITKAEYEEYGGEYVKEHRWGNLYTGDPSS